jgi:two-component system, sensor histidine kinase and response regulator
MIKEYFFKFSYIKESLSSYLFLSLSFCLLLLPFFSIGQGMKIEKRYAELNSASQDTVRLRLLSEFAWLIHNSDSSQKYYQEAILLSEKLNETKYLSQNLNRYGVTFRNIDLQETALELYERALNLSLTTNNRIEEGYAYNNIAQILRYQGLHGDAEAYYRKAEAIFTTALHDEGLGYTYIGLGNLYRELGNYDKAIAALDKSLSLRKDNKESRQYLSAILSRGDFYREIKDYEKALADYHKYLAEVQDVYRRGEMNVYGRLAILHYEQQNIQEALQYAHKAIAIHEQSPSLEIILPVYRELSKYYADKKDFANAYKYNLEYSKSKELLFEERINNYLTNYKIRSQEAEIKGLEMDRQIQADKDIMKKYLNSGLTALLFLSAIMVLIYYKSYQREKNNLALVAMQKKEIQKQAEELNHLNSVKDKLFSILAHDLRGPLNSLRGLIQLLEEETLTPEEFKEVIPLVSQNVGNNSILLENLLMWSRSQMQGMQMLNEKVKINQIFFENLEYIEQISNKKNIKIQNLVPDEVVVKADQGMVDIVMRNILTNAIKFTPAGGEIVVDAQDEIDSWKIIISDSGVGIAEENLPKIFGDKFFTTSGTQKEKGSGLGLLLSKELIEKNNGKIWLHSVEGEGTSFYFTLPKA